MSEELNPCPFCGATPFVTLAKKTHCQMHGEPSQAVKIQCKCLLCWVKPSVERGDIYNGGREIATAEAIEAWNSRFDDTAALKAAVISANEMAELMHKYVEDKSVSKADLALMAMSWLLQHEITIKSAGEKT